MDKIADENLEDRTKVEQVGRYVKESFDMHLKGTDITVPVVINHTTKRVKIGEMVFNRQQFNQLLKMGPDQARAILLSGAVLDGELVSLE